MTHLVASLFHTLSVALNQLAAPPCPPLAPPPIVAPPAQDIDGSWTSDGYGMFVEIHGNTLVAYEVTRISALRSMTLWLIDRGEGRWLGVSGDGDMFELTLESKPTKRLAVYSPGTASSIHLSPTKKSLPVFEDKDPQDPLYNFDVFCQTFSDHYPFFELKGIDWEAKTKIVRAGLDAASSDAELFRALVEMVEPLADSHVWVEGTGDNDEYSGFRIDDYDTDDERTFLRRARSAYALMEMNLFEEGGDGAPKSRVYANGNALFAHLKGGAGYLRITDFSDFGFGPFPAQLQQFEGELDEIFENDLTGLIIDLRENFGGSDIYGLAIAGRLTSEPYVAYRKVARNDPSDARSMTVPQPSIVTPRQPGFYGPVVVLTSRYTISAGETFTLALMGREPAVIRVGRSTQGVFSDVLGRELPNCFEFGLPNELFLDEKGETFDGPGIPPDHEVPVFVQADLDEGCDPAMEKALELLKAR